MLIVGLGAALRFVGLGWESLWYDEACTLDMVSASFTEIVSGKTLTPGNPSGYFALLRLWCEQFGFQIESARAFSALCGTLLIPATWLAASRMTGDRQVSLLAALLVAVSPPMVFLSREARVYPLLALFAVLATLYAHEIVCSKGKRGWLGFTMTCAVLPHFHYYSFFFLVALGGLLLWGMRDSLKSTLGRLLLCYAVIAFAFLPGLRLFVTQLGLVQKVAVNSLMQILSFPVFVFGDRTLVWKQDGVFWLGLVAFLIIVGIWLPVCYQLLKDRSAPWFAILTGSGVFLMAVLASGVYMSMFNARYVSFVVPLLLIGVADAIIKLHRQGGFVRLVPAVLLTLVTCVSLGRMYTEVQKDDWQSLNEYIVSHGPRMPVVFYEDIGATTFKYFQPDHPYIQLFVKFGNDGQAWYDAGYDKTISDLTDYWVVITPIWTDDVPEQVARWCSQFSTLVDQKSFKGLYLARFSKKTIPGQTAAPIADVHVETSPEITSAQHDTF